ncbi:uncharacterized protein LOC129636048 [Bubalus kerabau]|uniref:uncharacterized protein LOC129636048 n=1 Tax=Bubalus carabanensis TaxID=3119969 RepID=UPI00244EABE7|nr:uncharacterized protein LOC129636048 [Bubalus carabanensis]
MTERLNKARWDQRMDEPVKQELHLRHLLFTQHHAERAEPACPGVTGLVCPVTVRRRLVRLLLAGAAWFWEGGHPEVRQRSGVLSSSETGRHHLLRVTEPRPQPPSLRSEVREPVTEPAGRSDGDPRAAPEPSSASREAAAVSNPRIQPEGRPCAAVEPPCGQTAQAAPADAGRQRLLRHSRTQPGTGRPRRSGAAMLSSTA